MRFSKNFFTVSFIENSKFMHPSSLRVRFNKQPVSNPLMRGLSAGFAVYFGFTSFTSDAEDAVKPPGSSKPPGAADSGGAPETEQPRPNEAGSKPASSGFGLGIGAGLLGEPRLILGPGGGGPGAPQGRSNSSLGPLPEVSSDLKSIRASGGEDLPDVDIRRRARPDLLPDGPNPTEEAAIALKERIRYRVLKARVISEPEVAAALDAVKKAPSDREMRAAFRRHYELLFARMRELDASLENIIAERETEANSALRVALPR
jgi:hypothetical protein